MTTKVGMRALVTGTVVLAALTGCSGDGDGDGGDDFAGQSADKIVEQAEADMDGLKSVRVTGSVTTDGQEIELDMQLNTDADCTGTIGFGGGTTELRGTGGSVWMKPDEGFWKSFAGDSAEQVMAVVGDKWVVVPAGEEGFAELCDLDQLLGELVSDDDGTTYEKAGTEELDGEEVLVIESSEEDGVSTGYVLADAPHYLVKIEHPEGDEPGSVTFGDFDADVAVEEPAKDEVIDLSSVG